MARIFLSAFVVALGLVPLSGAMAQSNADKLIPAEEPPLDFTGREYVDSRGCIYVRAGVNGDTTWVPRMTRSREVICEQTPTFANVAAPRVEQSAAVTEVPVDPKSAVEVQPVQQVARVTPKPKPQPKKRYAPVKLSTYQAPCGQGGPCGAYRASRHEPVMQPAAPGPLKYRKAAKGEVSDSDRIVPRHVYEQQRLSKVYPPYGYQEAWDDDRLNPKRTNQTLKGRAQMALIWTNTVPRQLVDAKTGKVMNSKYPKLVYPFTSMAEQTAYLSSKGEAPVVKKVKKPKKVAKHQATGGASYVQIGVFGSRSNAEFAAAQLTRLGMPSKVGLFTRGGTEYQIVMAGPYANAAAASSALSKLRSAGYSDAYIR